MLKTALLVSLSFVVGCGGGGSNMGDDGDDQPAADAPDNPPIPDAPPPPEGFTRLIGRTWTLPPGATDTYRCVRVTVPEDTYITNIIAQAPVGTHHTVLSFASGNAAGPDGETDCNVSEIGRVMLYASGVGTSPLDFPTDVGIKLAAGSQIHLNLHLFNATDNPIGGDTAILVKAQATPPPTLAEMAFAGAFLVRVPADNQPHTIVGGCKSNRDFSLFAVWPHMHQIAVHQKLERIRNGAVVVLHDMPFAFAEQNYYLQTPEVEVKTGDSIRVSCTYVNNTGQEVRFGESSNDEMCFTGLYRYPAANAGLFECTDTGGIGF